MLSAMEKDGGKEHESSVQGEGAKVMRLRPLRVLIVSVDYRFRTVISMLIARRGCSAFSVGGADDVAEMLVRERVDVMLIDGVGLLREIARDVAQSDASAPPIGVVLVGESTPAAPAGLVSLTKWGAFGALFAAIVEADRARSRPSSAGHVTGLSEIRTHELG
jgi:hypothetical protein